MFELSETVNLKNNNNKTKEMMTFVSLFLS